MPEEVENLEDTNNEEGNAETNVDASSKSPLKDVAGNVASNIVDFNKYKSRKNNKANIDSGSTKQIKYFFLSFFIVSPNFLYYNNPYH